MDASARRPVLPAVLTSLLLSVSAGLAPAQSPGAVPGMGPVAQQEKAIWEALKTGNWDAIAPYMAPNFVYVGQAIGDRASSEQGVRACKLNSYTLHDVQSRTLANDMVLVTYGASVDDVCSKQPFQGELNCSSLWQKQNGKWMGIAHTEAIVVPH